MATETDTRLCAVEGCPAWGEPQVCLYDGRYHHHGRIHYGARYPEMEELGITFRDIEDGGWRGICSRHYGILREGRRKYDPELGGR